MGLYDTNAQIANDITNLIAYWRTRDVEFAEWLTGTADGGPFFDGRYPLTDYLGVIQYLNCPAALQAQVDGPTDSALAYSTAAEAARDLAQGYASAADAAKVLALTYRDAALAAKVAAEAARDTAASHSANAAGYLALMQAINNAPFFDCGYITAGTSNTFDGGSIL